MFHIPIPKTVQRQYLRRMNRGHGFFLDIGERRTRITVSDPGIIWAATFPTGHPDTERHGLWQVVVDEGTFTGSGEMGVAADGDPTFSGLRLLRRVPTEPGAEAYFSAEAYLAAAEMSYLSRPEGAPSGGAEYPMDPATLGHLAALVKAACRGAGAESVTLTTAWYWPWRRETGDLASAVYLRASGDDSPAALFQAVTAPSR